MHHSLNYGSELKATEKAILHGLSPLEPLIMKIQSYIVCEKPHRSFILLVIFHVLFFYIKISGQRVAFVVSMVLLVVFVINTWRRKIWPEIRVRPPSPEGPDQWTPVHLRLLSVPEISYHLAAMLHNVKSWSRKWFYLRANHSFLFCILNVAVFSTFAIIGRYISGFLIIYILFISTVLWPSFYYHDIPQKLYLYCEPLFMKLDYYLTFRGKFPGADKPEQDDDQKEEEEFLLSLDPAVTAALARAITDSEDEEASPQLSAQLSKQSSLNGSDEHDMVLERDLLPSLGDMPDVVDSVDDQFLPDLDSPVPRRTKKRRPRAIITTDTFQPPPQSDAPTADVLSAAASQIVSTELSNALATVLGVPAQPIDTRQPDAAADVTRHASDDSDIDQIISDDFDFLDEEGL